MHHWKLNGAGVSVVAGSSNSQHVRLPLSPLYLRWLRPSPAQKGRVCICKHTHLNESVHRCLAPANLPTVCRTEVTDPTVRCQDLYLTEVYNKGEYLQNKEGADQVWEGVLSDYQGCRKIGEEEQRESPCS